MKKLKTKFALNFIWLVILTVTCKANAIGNQIGGVVIDENHQLIENAQITYCDKHAVTDANGKFEINSELCGDLLTISKSGYNSISINPETLKQDSVVLISAATDEVILLNMVKEANEISEAVSYISGSEIEDLPGTNRLTTLEGRLPGLLVMQSDGQPGKEDVTISIRGRNTFGELRSGATILVDGHEADITLLNPYDIESITVLKDAASTAMYGLRGGNGVILVNTKRGREGDLKVNLNSQTSISNSAKFPQTLGAGTYAELYNEALINDGQPPLYSSGDIETFRNGSSPLSHPNNNYISDYFDDSFMQTRNNLNISGGGKNANYIFSLGHLYNDGLMNTIEAENAYNTNTELNAINLHGNIGIQVTNKLNVNVDIKAKKDKRTQPGSYSSNGVSTYLNQMLATPPNAYPTFAVEDSLGGTADYRNNFYGQLNRAGYSFWERYYLSGFIDFTYDLDFVEGLSVIGSFGYNTFGDNIIDRSKSFAVYEYQEGLATLNKIGDDTEMLNRSTTENVNRYFESEVGLSYTTTFGESTLDGKLLAERRMVERSVARIPHWYQGFKGRLDYGLGSTYFATFAFSFQGSEQFPPDNRYGLFPALSLGWVISNEAFMDNTDFISYLKLRSSAGINGNDFDSFTSSAYFAYIGRFEQSGSYQLGPDLGTSVPRFGEVAGANDMITWSKTKKYDIGLDASFFDARLIFSADYFFERTDDILVGGTPGILGMEYLYPDGIVVNSGVEGMFSWNQQIGSDMSFYLSANGTYARNEIIAQNEEAREYEWLYRTGNPIGSRYGYSFDRFFTENDDFSALSDQSSIGSVIPGSLKYKDLNNDNIIDERDISYLGHGDFPELWYGFSGGFEFKSFDFNFQFSGVANRTVRYSGDLAYAINNGKGSVNEWHLDRWQPGNEQNATYPSLSNSNFQNNKVTSDFWLEDGSFLRLRSIQLGFTLPQSIINRLGLQSLRLFVNGSNLFSVSKVTMFDPAGNTNGTSYPIPRLYTGGINLSF
ncbi:MAG: SusC/RagA family TonB-linked outer membrane protein [Bacteroidales bacterium]